MRDSCRFSDRVVEVVPEDAGRWGFFTELARSTGEHEFIVVPVFFRVEHVRAEKLLAMHIWDDLDSGDSPFSTKSEGNLLFAFRLLVIGRGGRDGHDGDVCGEWMLLHWCV